MPSTLPNTGMQIPTPGGDQNAWGNILNASLTTLDGLLPSPSTQAEGDIPRYTASGALAVDGLVAANATVAMEIASTGVINFDQPPTIGGTSTPVPLGLGLGELRSGLGTADVTYGTGEAWLVCDGRTLSAGQQTTYAAYVAAHGATLPDFRNKTPRGYLSGTTPAPGTGTFGSDSVSLAVGNMPNHNHGGTLSLNLAVSDSGHSHGSGSLFWTAPASSGNVGNGFVIGTAISSVGNIPVQGNTAGASANISASGNVVIPAQGSGTAFSVVPNSAIMNYFVRVA